MLASNKERLRHLEESQRILAQQLERVQADMNAATKSVLEWREGYHEANDRMRVAQNIATDALGAAAEHESRANALQALRESQQNMSVTGRRMETYGSIVYRWNHTFCIH